MISPIGYKFQKAAKQWVASFVLAASPAAAADTTHQYRLFSAPEMREMADEAEAHGNEQQAFILDNAAQAIEETQDGLRGSPNELPDDFDDKLYVDHGGETFKHVDPARYVDWTERQIAQKTAKIKAEFVPSGTVVETIMADGHVETSKTAGDEGGYKVTNATGEQYLIETAALKANYDGPDENGIFTPKPDPRKVMPVKDNIVFEAPWGGPMYIKKDGVLVHGGVNDIYGIQPDEYAKTYSTHSDGPGFA